MSGESHGQYCPIARAVETIGQRWSVLILRDLILGTERFNDLARGLPGLSRTLLSKRLRELGEAGIVRKVDHTYQLTEAGRDLEPVIMGLGAWGAKWTFDDPREDELDSELLVWWMHTRLRIEILPEAERFVIHLRFENDPKRFWIVIDHGGPSVCLADPGFEIDVTVDADLSTMYQVWLGRRELRNAIREDLVALSGRREAIDLVPELFLLSKAAAFSGHAS